MEQVPSNIVSHVLFVCNTGIHIIQRVRIQNAKFWRLRTTELPSSLVDTLSWVTDLLRSFEQHVGVNDAIVIITCFSFDTNYSLTEERRRISFSPSR